MKNVDFVIEAVTENEEVKKSIFQKLDSVRCWDKEWQLRLQFLSICSTGSCAAESWSHWASALQPAAGSCELHHFQLPSVRCNDTHR